MGIGRLSGSLPVWAFIAVTALSLFLTGCDKPTQLEQIQQQNKLLMLTRNTPTTYFHDRDEPSGFEYELARQFANELGVELEVRAISSVEELINTLIRPAFEQPVTFAAAGLSITPERQQKVAFSPPYMNINLHLVYNRKLPKPAAFDQLTEGELVVEQGGHHEERVRSLIADFEPQWSSSDELESMDLLQMVDDGEIAYTIVDSNLWATNYIYFPNARIAFDLQPGEQLAWAFPKGKDRSLQQEAEQFFARIAQDGTLAHLNERFYGHVDQLDYVGVRTFMRQLDNRLPKYRELFIGAAQQHELDWKLLAAVGYQESHWRPTARSPTGVRGLMMLTLPTAKEMDVDNRLDPVQSINGGARYFAKIKRRIPESIREPDRTWMALAAYNVGRGHLEDARVITEKRGGNPNRWVDVKKNLPLLAQKKWYKSTRYGYARGHEPVAYVQNIRRYYDLIRWTETPQVEASQLAQTSHEPGISEEAISEPSLTDNQGSAANKIN
ncbi:membrane-bound lytic murein transglycosylase MltF [Aestuariirhabdus sp. Z084]|uniref:membrane-bound lytic murein transglycosylase MltF n=1 Tax=Aestuariirhabdus haliotis TaxID=2918751 RepID=UPI00201B3C38|nr:membrane-bound lytic murein transglycosylase MltF [Aestuariirhabdus haliotis]MCL6415878.1 membrane-bound lytic murein transglycosylase MltF [Aestuariirhabdus haliotis]MCL6419820.1 membrane-bound lytic murein transglycosylase MltF [Aestuariirhabdus haliotis]